MTRRGLLLTVTEPPAAMDEEFNAWYDDEHLPERLAIPGFRSARRWVADGVPGEGRYLATYELDSPGVLFSPAYLARFENQTPWSKRCLGKAVVFRRWACEQVEPGDAEPSPGARFLVCVAAGAPVKLSIASLQARRFVASAGDLRHIALFELASQSALPSPEPGMLLRLYRAYA